MCRVVAVSGVSVERVAEDDVPTMAPASLPGNKPSLGDSHTHGLFAGRSDHMPAGTVAWDMLADGNP